MSDNNTKAAVLNLLQECTGDWIMEGQCVMPDGSTQSFSGEETVKLLGDTWLVAQCTTPNLETGDDAHNVMTIGYDDTRQTIVGSFVTSAFAYLWIYESGELSDDGKTITLNTTGPAFLSQSGGQAQYRDIFALREGGRRSLTSKSLDANGNWVQFMEAIYRRSE